MASGDRSFMQKAAEGGMAEVQLGELAKQKAASDQVKQFAQRMIDDHGKANDRLKEVASSKGVTLPTNLASKDQLEKDRLSKLSGNQFDKAYMDHMVADHKQDVSEFKSQSTKAKDPDVKNFVVTTLPTLEEHLQLAQTTDRGLK
jgi:putative membrane protein